MKSLLKKIFKDHPWEAWGCLLTILLISSPASCSAYRGFGIDAANAGVFGDFIGGYFGTIALIISIGFIAVSHKSQKAADKDSLFEARFIELLKLHRENTSEMSMDDIQGKRSFVYFIREWRSLRKIVTDQNFELNENLTNIEISKLSYLIFYYGIGENSTRVLRGIIDRIYPQKLIDAILAKVEESLMQHKLCKSQNLLNEHLQSLPSYQNLFPYIPFGGHQSRLPHYFRNLFHLIKYTNNREPNKQPKDFVKLVRAQLTTQEQALIALHSLSISGSWFDTESKTNFIDEFHLIKNIPEWFFAPEELSLLQEFPNVKFGFMRP